MNPEQPSREQIEARITALLLGELPEDEAVLLRWTLSRDPELSKLHDRLKTTIGLVRETVAHPAEAPVEKIVVRRLSEERRRRLLEHFKTPRPTPKPLSWLKRIEVRPLVGALAVVALLAVLAAMMLPALASAKRKAQNINIVNNLKQLDLAKNEWAADNNKSGDAVVTMDDLKPYLGNTFPRSVAGEKYEVGKVSEPATADIDAKKAKQIGSLASRLPSGGAAGGVVQLSSDGTVALLNEAKQAGESYKAYKGAVVGYVEQNPAKSAPATPAPGTAPQQKTEYFVNGPVITAATGTAAVQPDMVPQVTVTAGVNNTSGGGTIHYVPAAPPPAEIFLPKTGQQLAESDAGGTLTVQAENRIVSPPPSDQPSVGQNYSYVEVHNLPSTIPTGPSASSTSGGTAVAQNRFYNFGTTETPAAPGQPPAARFFAGQTTPYATSQSSAAGMPDQTTIAKIPPILGDKADAATHVQNGKLLYEAGKYDESMAEMNQALKAAPDNYAASYYMNLDREAESASQQNQRTVEKSWTPKGGIPNYESALNLPKAANPNTQNNLVHTGAGDYEEFGSTPPAVTLSPPPPAATTVQERLLSIQNQMPGTDMPRAPAASPAPPNSSESPRTFYRTLDSGDTGAARHDENGIGGVVQQGVGTAAVSRNDWAFAGNDNAGIQAQTAPTGPASGALGGRGGRRGGGGGRGGAGRGAAGGAGGIGGGFGGFGGGGIAGAGGGGGGFGGGGFGGGGGRGGAAGGPGAAPAPEVAAKASIPAETQSKNAGAGWDGYMETVENGNVVAKGGGTPSANGASTTTSDDYQPTLGLREQSSISVNNGFGLPQNLAGAAGNGGVYQIMNGGDNSGLPGNSATDQVLSGGLQNTGPGAYNGNGIVGNAVQISADPNTHQTIVIADEATAGQIQEVLRSRVDRFGVAEPIVSSSDNGGTLAFDNSGRTAAEKSVDRDQLAVNNPPVLGDSPVLGRLFQEQQKSAPTAPAPGDERRRYADVNGTDVVGANTFVGGTVVGGGTLDVNGDNSYTMHQGNGNLLLADGSVQSASQGQLKLYDAATKDELAINAPASDNKKDGLHGFYDDNYQANGGRDSGVSQVQNAEPAQVAQELQQMFNSSTRQNQQNGAIQQRLQNTAQNTGAISTSSGLNSSGPTTVQNSALQQRAHSTVQNMGQISTSSGLNGNNTVRVALADGNTVNTANVPSTLGFSSTSTPASTTPAGSPTLVMRVFRINTNTFYQGMQGATSESYFWKEWKCRWWWRP